MEEPAFPVPVKKAICYLLVLSGLVIYLFWGVAYGAWNPFAADYIGVYALMAVLIGIGGMGIIILRLEDEEQY